MARRTFLEPFEDTQLIFNRVIDTTLLRQNGITVIILVDNTAKKLYHPVLANPIHKHRTGDDVIITLNETIFEQLTDEQKEIVAHQVLAYINYDLEKDKLSIVKPDVIEHSGVVQRFGIDAITTLRLSVESLYQQEESDAVEAEHII
jgi:hypothetical protein